MLAVEIILAYLVVAIALTVPFFRLDLEAERNPQFGRLMWAFFIGMFWPITLPLYVYVRLDEGEAGKRLARLAAGKKWRREDAELERKRRVRELEQAVNE